jgi:hypothetical protein
LALILVAVGSALSFVDKMRIPIKYMISVGFVLILFIASSLFVFNAHAQQQGDAATGGSATSGSNVAGPANCYGNATSMVRHLLVDLLQEEMR